MAAADSGPFIEICVPGLDGELAEAVREVMDPFGRGGAVVECRPAVRTVAGPDCSAGELQGARYSVRVFLEDQPGAEAEVRRLQEALWYLSAIRPFPPPRVRRIEACDWSREWRTRHGRIRAGRTLLVVPPWDSGPFAADDRVLVVEPANAFGSGAHPSTRLCLGLLENVLRGGEGVLDLGCGSGVLSLAAARLGARRVVAIDLDRAAVRATVGNAQRSGVSDRVFAVQGSITAVRGPFQVIAANIVASVLVRLIPEAAPRLAPAGRLVLSGILRETESGVREVLSRCGLAVGERCAEGDWIGLVAGR